MAIECVDISTQKNIQNASPIPMVVFLVLFSVLSVVYTKLDIVFLILTVSAFAGSMIFFQHRPTDVMIGLRFVFTRSLLSPNFKDKMYLPDHKEIKNLNKIVVDD